MDKLLECAVAYKNLFDVTYDLKIGSKNKLVELSLYFAKENFYHLIGLEKLNDIQKVRGNPNKIFDKIINGKISYSDISKSEFFGEIKSRLDYFPKLEKFLDDDYFTVAFNKQKSYSNISAKYLFYLTDKDNYIHYFISTKENDKNYFGVTFFVRENNDYIIGQRKFKILYKAKKRNSKLEKILINKPIEQKGAV